MQVIRKVSRHVTYANVVATLCMATVLGGTAWAAGITGAGIVDGSIQSRDLLDNDVRGLDIRNGTVTGLDVLNGSVGGADIRDNTVRGVDVANGSLQGTDLASGAVGSAAISDGAVASADIADGAVSPAKQGASPAATAILTSTQAIPSGSSTTISLTGEVFDTASMHDNATNPSKITAPVGGLYLVSFGVKWQVDNSGQRVAWAFKNGAPLDIIMEQRIVPGANFPVNNSVAVPTRLSAGDTVELRVNQNSTNGAVSALKDFNETYLSVVWLAP